MTELFFQLVLELGLVAHCKLLSLPVSSKEQYMHVFAVSTFIHAIFWLPSIFCDLLQLYNVVILIFILISWKIITCP